MRVLVMNIPDEMITQVREYSTLARQMIKDHRSIMTEQETETMLVEPLLDILQWNPKRIDDVRKGYSIKAEGANYEADYALMLNSKPRILIEVKKVAYNLSQEHVIHLMKYAFFVKADISILTNGYEWQIYEPFHLKGMIFSFDLENIESNMDYLWLLSKESIETGLLDQEINRRYAIEKVYEYINHNKEKWINEILATSKLPKDAINSIMGEVITDKATILNSKPKIAPPKSIIDPSKTKLEPITGKFTGKSILFFEFKGERYEATFWKDMLVKLCNILYKKHSGDFEKIFEIKGRKNLYFTHDKDQLIAPRLIPDTDIYVETSHSAMGMTWMCCNVLSKFGYSNEDLKVEVQEKEQHQ